MPFSHDIAGGQGNLVVSQIRSPNYVHGVSGWIIRKDGTAEFHDVEIPGTGGTTIYFASVPPTSASNGDVWYDTVNGMRISQWDGSEWVAYQFGTGAIANGAVTGDLLAESVTSRSLGGITTTLAATSPASPQDGDIWVNLAAGNQVQQYSGGKWNPISWNASHVIQPGTITTDQLAANSVTAGQIEAGAIDGMTISAPIITGGTIEGSTVQATNIGGEFLGYTSTPASGNLYISVSPTSGTDSHGNTYTDGVVIHGPSGTYAQLALNQNNNLPYLIFQPPNFNGYAWPQVYGQTNNQAAANQAYQLSLESGREPSRGGFAIFLISDTSDGAMDAYAAFGSEDTTGAFKTAMTITKTAISAYVPMESASPSWYNMLMSSGWTIGSGGYFQCKLMPDNTIAVRGSGLIPGTVANGTDIAVLPYVSFNPVTDRLPLSVWVNYTTPPSSIPATFPAELQVRSSGSLWCYGLNTGTVANISVYGRFPLD